MLVSHFVSFKVNEQANERMKKKTFISLELINPLKANDKPLNHRINYQSKYAVLDFICE